MTPLTLSGWIWLFICVAYSLLIVTDWVFIVGNDFAAKSKKNQNHLRWDAVRMAACWTYLAWLVSP